MEEERGEKRIYVHIALESIFFLIFPLKFKGILVSFARVTKYFLINFRSFKDIFIQNII